MDIVEKYREKLTHIEYIKKQLEDCTLHQKEYADKRREYFTVEARYKEMVYALDIMEELIKEIGSIKNSYHNLLGSWQDCLTELDNLKK